MEHDSSNSQTVIGIALLILVLVGGAFFFIQQNEIEKEVATSQEAVSDEFADWITYETSQGLVFQYPPGHAVTENTDPERSDVMNYFVVGLDHDDTLRQHPPVLQINASNSMVSIALWEGIAWEGYPKILETLKWK